MLDQETMPRAVSARLKAKYSKRTRVQLYLPIADIPVNVFLILAMGAAVGFLSRMVGIRGRFLFSPLFILLRTTPPVPVAAFPHPLRAPSVSGAPFPSRTRAVDPLL